MNKREISEIKKQFKKDNNAITRICGCYVDAEKQIKTTLKEAFFARHTPSARKLTCGCCGYHGFCVETLGGDGV